jgi:hypothetical protein
MNKYVVFFGGKADPSKLIMTVQCSSTGEAIQYASTCLDVIPSILKAMPEEMYNFSLDQDCLERAISRHIAERGNA